MTAVPEETCDGGGTPLIRARPVPGVARQCALVIWDKGKRGKSGQEWEEIVCMKCLAVKHAPRHTMPLLAPVWLLLPR